MKITKILIMVIIMMICIFPGKTFAFSMDPIKPVTPEAICTYTATVSGVGGNTFDKYYFYITKFENTISFTIGYETKEIVVMPNALYNNSKVAVKQYKSGDRYYNEDMTVKHVGPLLEAQGAPHAYDLEDIKADMTCPKFVWVGSDYFNRNFGIALYDQILDDNKFQSICDGSGGSQICYSNVYYEKIDEETSMSDQKDFNEKLQKFKDLITELDGLIDDNGEALNCKDFKDRYNTIYTELATLEAALTNYAKFDSTLTFDKDYGSDIRSLARKAEIYCRSDDDNDNSNYNPGDPQTGCEVIPKEIRKWINNILNFVRYVALILVIALGALDFMKAAGSGEPDAMKKAGQTFMKRMIAVVVLFLLPVIVDFILNMIDIYGVDKNNIDCL